MKIITKKHFSKRIASLFVLSLSTTAFSSSVYAADINTVDGFTFTALETPDGFSGVTSLAYDINDNGVVVGSSRKNSDSIKRAILWNSAGIGSELLGHSGSSDNNGSAKAINNSGQVVGSADGSATIWFDGINSIGTDLYSQLGGGAILKDINDAGLSIAYEKLLDSDLEPTSLAGITQELDALRLETIAINNNNNIVGTVSIPKSRYIATPTINPLLIEGNSYKLLGTLPNFEGGDARPSDINDNGHVVGVAYEGNADSGGLTGGLNSRAVIWENDLIASLGTLGGDKSSAIKTNSFGQVLGNSTDINNINHAFIWQNDVMYDLSAILCNTPNNCRTNAHALNNNGEIIASVNEPSGYKLLKFNFEEGALNNLPSVYAPLNFVIPTGTQNGSRNAQEGTDVSVSIKKPIVTRLNKRNYEVRYSSLFKNLGSKQAKNLVSKFTISGKLDLIKVFTSIGSCETEVSGTSKNRIATVICQHGDLNPDQIISRTVVVKAKRLRRLKAKDIIESDTNDLNISNNSVKLKGVKNYR